MHFLHRYGTATDGIDVVVTKEKNFMVFWPTSEEAKRVCEQDLDEFQSRFGGYVIQHATWKVCYDHLDHDRGLTMAWSMSLGGTGVTFIEVHM